MSENIAGRASNRFVGELADDPLPAAIGLKKLSVAAMRMKSRSKNRLLKAWQIGCVDRLKRRRLDLCRSRRCRSHPRGLHWEDFKPPPTSQECPECGFTRPQSRPTRTRCQCLICGDAENADPKAAVVIENRSDDDELNLAIARHTVSGG